MIDRKQKPINFHKLDPYNQFMWVVKVMTQKMISNIHESKLTYSIAQILDIMSICYDTLWRWRGEFDEDTNQRILNIELKYNLPAGTCKAYAIEQRSKQKEITSLEKPYSEGSSSSAVNILGQVGKENPQPTPTAATASIISRGASSEANTIPEGYEELYFRDENGMIQSRIVKKKGMKGGNGI